MNKLLNGKAVVVLVIVLAMMVLPFAWAAFYNGFHALFQVKNNDNNSVFNARLHAYGDSADANGMETCFDRDNGLKPFTGGSISWTDVNVNYVLSDSCENVDVLHEYACAKDIMVWDGNSQYLQFTRLAGLWDMNCADFNMVCSTDLNGMTVPARCV